MQNPTNTQPLTEQEAEGNNIAWPQHRDVTPAPQPIRNGQLLSVCSCGQTFIGIDADHADWQLNDHIDDTEKPEKATQAQKAAN
ncbi:hypothetical protein [Kribbella jiaozuonensis]|uniref:Uncharacterized protein n=1 Tax=Kribbella jiaozuonensis TaxID=2575441 RepID=A0A4U3LT21_9ACTN|nr:hypothetical protein [Kribbella jiaozuonensis]TKK79168.1 hypothetical protein FDA38_12105 [Kribbella jiaozuonensis]TKK83238.1 hypothetical protein FDA38_11060 [Kribbella jiaozuonensis]